MGDPMHQKEMPGDAQEDVGDAGTPLLDDEPLMGFSDERPCSAEQTRPWEGRSSGGATPTLDDNVGGIPAPLTSRLDALTQGRGADEASASELGEIPLPSSRDTPVEDELPEPPVQPRISESSNYSPVSNSSFLGPEEATKADDVLSLSDLSSSSSSSSNEASQEKDLEDGEISASKRKSPKNGPHHRSPRRRTLSSQSYRSGSREGYGRRKGRRKYRDRGSPSFPLVDDDDDDARFRKKSKDESGRRRSVHDRRGDLPRYDVRNVVEKKRNGSLRAGRSRSRSRSWSRESFGRKPQGRKKRRSWSRSPSRKRSRYSSGCYRSRSRSRSPRSRGGGKRKKNKSGKKRSSRSPSPRRYGRSPSWEFTSKGGLRSRSPAAGVSPKKLGKSSKAKGKNKAAQKRGTAVPVDGKKKRKRNRDRPPHSPEGEELTSKKKKSRMKKGKATGPAKKGQAVNGEVASSRSSKVAGKKKRKSNDGGQPSVITEKEVFTSGDKIMVSVNFKQSLALSERKVVTVENTVPVATIAPRPTVVIDVMSSPYQVIEPSPQAVIDVFTDDEDNRKGSEAASNRSEQLDNNDAGGNPSVKQRQGTSPPSLVALRSPSSVAALVAPAQHMPKGVTQVECVEIWDQDQQQQPSAPTQQQQQQPQPQQQQQQHKGPCTPPSHEVQSLNLSRGPQTPMDDPLGSYDPCDPTESPEIDGGDDFDDDGDHQNGGISRNSSASGHRERDSLLKTAANTIPFLLEDNGATESSNNNCGVTGGVAERASGAVDSDKMDLSVDMDMDSPFSPQSSELSDIFEPPLNTPLTNKKLSNAMASKKSHKTIKHKGGKASKNKHIHMKIVDDQLRIVDDVPTSAVEMAVKEKFLKKVQRQERIVEEIKMVLKPHYNRKRINKDDYKEILRKCVPKVCHSKKGDINPLKIQRLVKGYVKKYHVMRKRRTSSR